LVYKVSRHTFALVANTWTQNNKTVYKLQKMLTLASDSKNVNARMCTYRHILLLYFTNYKTKLSGSAHRLYHPIYFQGCPLINDKTVVNNLIIYIHYQLHQLLPYYHWNTKCQNISTCCPSQVIILIMKWY